jgi:hypothetical protein
MERTETGGLNSGISWLNELFSAEVDGLKGNIHFEDTQMMSETLSTQRQGHL